MPKRKREDEVKPIVSSSSTYKRKIKEQMTTVKCGLKAIIRDADVAQAIQDSVLSLSAMMFEATKLLNLHALRVCESQLCSPTWLKSQTVIEYAFRLVSSVGNERKEKKVDAKTATDKEKKTAEHKNLLAETYQKYYLPTRPADLAVPSRSRIGQLLRYARDSFKTAAQNHVATNFYRRHRQYIRFCVQDITNLSDTKTVGAVVHRLYKVTTCEAKSIRGCKTLAELLPGNVTAVTQCESIAETIRERLQSLGLFPVVAWKLERQWFSFLPYFHDMQQLAEQCTAKAQVDFQMEHKTPTKTKGVPACKGKKRERKERRPYKPKVRRSEQLRSAMSSSFVSNVQGPKTFTLLPEFGMQAKNVIIDTAGLRDICAGIRAKTKPKRGERKAAEEADDELWERVLNMHKIPRHRKTAGFRFGNILSTDGVCVNLNLRRPFASAADAAIPDDPAMNPQPDELRTAQPVFQPMEIGQDIKVVGLDPGSRDLFVAVDNQQERRVTSCSTKQYYWDAGFTRRQRETGKWMKRNPDVAKALKGMPSSRVSTSTAYLVHVKHALSAYQLSKRFYLHPRHRRWKKRVYSGKQRVLDKLCKAISGSQKSTVVAFGAANFSAVARGHASGPVQTLKHRLRQHCTVVDVDEFRTSQMCSKCQCQQPMSGLHASHDPYKVRVCPNQECRTIWNRDVNAARNMMSVFLFVNSHEGVLRPERFRRS